jgi:hypothetical protein
VVASRSGKGGEGSVLRAGLYWLGEEKEVVAMKGDGLGGAERWSNGGGGSVAAQTSEEERKFVKPK